jgi:hypothetical protein
MSKPIITAEEIKARQIAAGTYVAPVVTPEPHVPEYITQIMADERYLSCQKAKDGKPKHTVGLKARLEMKTRAVELKGGRCVLCGYKRCARALEFHHVDPTRKDFTIAAFMSQEFYYSGWTTSSFVQEVWRRVEKELKKCVLLCANCHREVEAGVVELPKEGGYGTQA